jgi:hypothetical protein
MAPGPHLMPIWLSWLWLRVQAWIGAALLLVGALVSAWIVGRRSGTHAAKVRAAQTEQKARRAGDAAAADAERDGAADRLRRGRF